MQQYEISRNNDYKSQIEQLQNIINLQERYNKQKAEIDAANTQVQKVNEAIANSAIATPSRYAQNVKLSGFKDREYDYNNFSSQGTNIPNAYNGPDDINFSFDADVSNLKSGDVLDIITIDINNKTNGHATTVAGWVNGAGTPLMVNGVQYGTIYTKLHNANTGKWEFAPAHQFDIADKIAVYAVITKDVPGIGNQHFDFKDTGNITLNYVALPAWYAGHNEINFELVAHPSDPNQASQILGVEHHKLHQLTPIIIDTTQANGLEMHPESDNNTSFWSRIFDKNNLLNGKTFNKWKASNYTKGANIQDYYYLNQRVTNSTGFMTNESNPQPVWSTNGIQAEIQVANSEGHFLAEEDVNSTRNKPSLAPSNNSSQHNHYLADHLTISQMHAEIQKYLSNHPKLTQGSDTFFSKQDDKTYLVVSVASKESLQNSLKAKLNNPSDYGADDWAQASFDVQADKDPAHAAQNTKWYLSQPGLDGMSQWNTWGNITFNYKDPTVVNYQTIAQLDDNGNTLFEQKSQSLPPKEMHNGQSGIKVHYINGKTGQEMQNWNWSIGDSGKTLEVQPQAKAGWQLSTEGAKGIPAGAQTIENNTNVTYPAQGTWKDVYVVYMPYSTGQTTASYHYNTAQLPNLPKNGHKPHVPVPDKPQLTPHQELIPFTETPPTPPVFKSIPVEPTKPTDLSLDQHNVIINYTPSPSKQWEENNVNTNDKIYMNNETPTAHISVNIPNEANLKSFELYEDYSQFPSSVSVLSVHVLHNGQLENDSDFTISDDKNGHLTLTRNNMDGFTGGKYELITQFKINDNVAPNTVLNNNGGVILNGHSTPVTPVKITTWNPNPTKDVNLGTNDTDKLTESANNWKITDGQSLTYPLQNITLPANRNTTFTSWEQTDTLDPHLTYNGYKAFLQGQDVSNHVQMAVNGQQLSMKFDDWLLQQMNSNKGEAFKMPLILINATAHGQDGAEIDNKYSIKATVKNIGDNATGTGSVQEHTINLTSNTVRNYLIKDTVPVKEDLNTNGVNIDGMNVTPGSTQNYRLIKDFSSYKDAHVSADHQTFYWVDDWPEQALQDPDMNNVKVINQKGETVQGLTGKVYNSISELPQNIQGQLKANNINPTDKFILWSGDSNFIKSQILAGNKVTISLMGIVKDNFNGKYENKSYTITFGHGSISNIVTNNVEKINPTKDVVLDVNNLQSLNNQNIKLGQVFDYKLNGQIIPANTGTPLTQYGWQDKFDTEHDQLTGQVKAIALVDIKLNDGTVLKKGTDLTKYLDKTVNSDGSITWQFKKDFLNKVNLKDGTFGATLYVQAKRIKAGDVRNQYVFWLNGKPYKSNTVLTHTPEPAKSTTPQINSPITPTGYGSPAPANQLAQTGTNNQHNNAALIGLGLATASLSLGSLGLIGKKKQTNNIELKLD